MSSTTSNPHHTFLPGTLEFSKCLFLLHTFKWGLGIGSGLHHALKNCQCLHIKMIDRTICFQVRISYLVPHCIVNCLDSIAILHGILVNVYCLANWTVNKQMTFLVDHLLAVKLLPLQQCAAVTFHYQHNWTSQSLSHPSILGVTLCFCTGSYAAAAGAGSAAAAGRRFLFTR